ncbi:PadR family transcriptional regulator [Paenibacillus aquistagni]|uniref:Transcriptional regulator PadR-like family protein n=1 Tax=Paenibacillus aquistagni TaxID=1852522 RepID=A0A1X7IVY1_9BACL|nr:helix-turn-helix transcriptional regulator [Paenibacillus aquistagni]NMM50973.1 PadR family transcriptional regulator [Paenibacillus aquistagni]SMG19243.1 Transcriptional regulator PadR-like family protein [Paenibacillus aquistagni]
MRNTSPIRKDESLGHVVKVQQVIDFMVLAELKKGRRYGKEIDQVIIASLGGVGVNDSYLSKRLRVLNEKGHTISYWDSDHRYFRYYEITDLGREYLNQLLKELPDRVSLALKVYQMFDQQLKKHD